MSAGDCARKQMLAADAAKERIAQAMIAIRAALFRRRDTFFALNIINIQVAQSKETSKEMPNAFHNQESSNNIFIWISAFLYIIFRFCAIVFASERRLAPSF